jgi:UDP-N-acetylglucosamine 1-carboxyvinyltransferase
MGAQIEGAGTHEIVIEGVDRLHGATHPVVIDRIELGTYMLAPAIAGGEVELLGGRIDLIGAFVDKLTQTGVSVTETEAGLKVARTSDVLRAVDVTTEPFPGFPTDLQAQMMALLCTADGCQRPGRADFREPVHACPGTRCGWARRSTCRAARPP